LDRGSFDARRRHELELAREVERFDPNLPIEEAWTPPASWYLDPAFLAREVERVFARRWLPAVPADQVAEPGTYAAGATLGRPWVVVRGEDGALRAFHNVCRHHAAEVMRGAGTCRELACPYHGWTYGCDGRLLRAPRAGGIRGFDRGDFGLLPLGVAAWGPLVLLHSDPAAPPPTQALAGLAERLGLDGLRFVAHREYRLRCNWKVFVDNYLDGGYHVPIAHGELAAQLTSSTYRTEVFEHYSVQACRSSGSSERLGREAVYAWVYPSLMLNRYGPVLDTNTVVPLGTDETLVAFDWYLEEGRAADTAFVEECLAASELVQEQDVALCESVQRGLASPAYDRGRYAPKLEAAMLHFHRLLAADLRA
jgi:choline monooxygenase